jgi:hypothetical protein
VEEGGCWLLLEAAKQTLSIAHRKDKKRLISFVKAASCAL